MKIKPQMGIVIVHANANDNEFYWHMGGVIT